jgi:hypothetical protein
MWSISVMPMPSRISTAKCAVHDVRRRSIAKGRRARRIEGWLGSPAFVVATGDGRRGQGTAAASALVMISSLSAGRMNPAVMAASVAMVTLST